MKVRVSQGESFLKRKPSQLWKDDRVSKVYWQAKIWGLLHDPALKALHDNRGRGGNSFWQDLEVMQDWKDNKWNPEESGKTIFKHIKLADYIASASDRTLNQSILHSSRTTQRR
jgi:CRISPR-associated protein Cmr2